MDSVLLMPADEESNVPALLGCLCGVASGSQDEAQVTAQTDPPLRTETLGPPGDSTRNTWSQTTALGNSLSTAAAVSLITLV